MKGLKTGLNGCPLVSGGTTPLFILPSIPLRMLLSMTNQLLCICHIFLELIAYKLWYIWKVRREVSLGGEQLNINVVERVVKAMEEILRVRKSKGLNGKGV